MKKVLFNIYHLIVDKKIPTLAGTLAFNIIINGGALSFLYILLSNLFSNNFYNEIINNIENQDLKDFLEYFFNYQNNLSYSLFLIISSL